MIKVKLVRHLDYGDKATKEMGLPYAPFVGLILDVAPMKFTITGIKYDGNNTWLSESRQQFSLGPEFTKKPPQEWIDKQTTENEAARQKAYTDYISAGWHVDISDEPTSVHYSYRYK